MLKLSMTSRDYDVKLNSDVTIFKVVAFGNYKDPECPGSTIRVDCGVWTLSAHSHIGLTLLGLELWEKKHLARPHSDQNLALFVT